MLTIVPYACGLSVCLLYIYIWIDRFTYQPHARPDQLGAGNSTQWWEPNCLSHHLLARSWNWLESSSLGIPERCAKRHLSCHAKCLSYVFSLERAIFCCLADLGVEFLDFLCILDIFQSLFFPILWLSFHSMWKPFNLLKSYLPVFCFCYLWFGDSIQKSLSEPIFWSIFLCFLLVVL